MSSVLVSVIDSAVCLLLALFVVGYCVVLLGFYIKPIWI